MQKTTKIISWAARIIAAVIMIQTLYFKFSASPESVYIFEKAGLGSAGRIGTGVLELFASVLLLITAYCWIGAGLGIALMSGAIVSHLTVLGIEVMNDGGLLFAYALTVLICCIVVAILHKQKVLLYSMKLIGRFK